jgi:hypothetical protein
MKKGELEALLADYFSLPARSVDPDLAVIEAALFVEQTFGIELGDDDISAGTLGTPEAIRRLIADRMVLR